jgi:hypothetical protein
VCGQVSARLHGERVASRGRAQPGRELTVEVGGSDRVRPTVVERRRAQTTGHASGVRPSLLPGAEGKPEHGDRHQPKSAKRSE